MSIRVYILAYNRSKSLERLLDSLSHQLTGVSEHINLSISIDKGGDDTVISLAKDYQWGYGTKDVNVRDKHLGLNEHIFTIHHEIIEQSEDHALVLEDDTFIAPGFLNMLECHQQHLDRFEQVFCCSFFKDTVRPNLRIPFSPVRSNEDFFVLQRVPSRGYLTAPDRCAKLFKEDGKDIPAPEYMRKWESGSWERTMYQLLVKQNMTVIYPYLSTSTGFGERGTHFHRGVSKYAVQAEISSIDKGFKVVEDWNALIKYDGYYELDSSHFIKALKEQSNKSIKSLDVDIYGTKRDIDLNHAYVLTGGAAKRVKALAFFGDELYPLEMNVILANPGTVLKVIKREDHVKPTNSSLRKQRFLGLMRSKTYASLTELIRIKFDRILRRY